MATAEELGGRRVPSFPGAKGDETQTFVGPDGNTIEVVKSISKDALAILKRRGFKSQTRAQKEQEEAALAKAEAADTTSSQEDETVGEDNDDDEVEHASRKTPAKKAASRSG